MKKGSNSKDSLYSTGNYIQYLAINCSGKEIRDFSGSSESKESAFNAGDPGSVPGSGRSPGKWNGYPLQYSCLENAMDRATWQVTVHGVAKSLTQLSN